jgi:hypothetical protein
VFAAIVFTVVCFRCCLLRLFVSAPRRYRFDTAVAAVLPLRFDARSSFGTGGDARADEAERARSMKRFSALATAREVDGNVYIAEVVSKKPPRDKMH